MRQPGSGIGAFFPLNSNPASGFLEFFFRFQITCQCVSLSTPHPPSSCLQEQSTHPLPEHTLSHPFLGDLVDSRLGGQLGRKVRGHQEFGGNFLRKTEGTWASHAPRPRVSPATFCTTLGFWVSFSSLSFQLVKAYVKPSCCEAWVSSCLRTRLSAIID